MLEVTLGLPPALRLNDVDVPMAQEEESLPLETTLRPPRGQTRHFSQMFGVRPRETSINMAHERSPKEIIVDLRRKTHVDLFNKPDEFEVHDSCGHQPVARDWPTSKKRFTAIVVCINTACLGLLIGIYAGEVPAIQYRIADFSHWTILGNVCLYCGLAISTLIFWPLSLLHGRKPYTLAGLALALGLQIPQGVVLMEWRMPGVVTWRLTILLCRALTGFAFGFVNINLQASLLDIFGASLQSRHPHDELFDPYDVRRHGGGMGLWLGAWSWCTIGPISLGFVVGAFIINTATVEWGFWTGLFLLTTVLLLNLIAPETRRSAFRRTIAEMTGTGGSFSRVTRGEIKMHLKSVGPFW